MLQCDMLYNMKDECIDKRTWCGEDMKAQADKLMYDDRNVNGDEYALFFKQEKLWN